RYGAGVNRVLTRVQVIGSGRVGGAVAGRLRERGVELAAAERELVLLCVPDSTIAEVASSIEPGPWIAHVSGATPLAALAPHVRRFSAHPLQTFTTRRGPHQLAGTPAPVPRENTDALTEAFDRPRLLGLRPF